jgi:hypothetical protein
MHSSWQNGAPTMIQSKILAALSCIALAGCGLARQAEFAKNRDAARAEAAAATEACKAKPLPTFAAKARCLNDAEAPLRAYANNPDLFNVRAASRVAFAEKVDAKQMTVADAELEFAKLNAQMTTEEQNRSNNSTAARASMIAATAAASPPSVSCTRFGNTVNCY